MSADTFEPKNAPVETLVMPWAADHYRAIILSGTILTALLVVSTLGILLAFLVSGGR